MGSLEDYTDAAEALRKQIKELKSRAPLFPRFLIEKGGDENEVIVTTIVEFKHNHTTYLRHIVVRAIVNKTVTVNDVYNKAYDNAEQCIKFGMPALFDDVKQ